MNDLEQLKFTLSTKQKQVEEMQNSIKVGDSILLNSGMYGKVLDIIGDTLNYKNTAGAVIQSFINDLPKNAEIASNIVDSFDKDKYKEVIEFAKYANAGRNI